MSRMENRIDSNLSLLHATTATATLTVYLYLIAESSSFKPVETLGSELEQTILVNKVNVLPKHRTHSIYSLNALIDL